MASTSNSKSRKFPQVERELTQWIREAGVGCKLPTVKEMCSQYGVAIGTLTGVLNVLEAQGLIERKHGHGIYVAPGMMQKRVALVFGTNKPFLPGASPFYGMLLQESERRAVTHNERFSFFIASAVTGQAMSSEYATPVHYDLTRALEERKLDGMILVARESPEQEHWLRRQGIPLVSYGTMLSADEPIPNGYVTPDMEAMVRLGLEALVEKDCRSVGLLAVRKEHRPVFCRLAEEAGLSVREEWIITTKQDGYIPSMYLAGIGREAAMQFMLDSGWSQKERNARALPDGMLITNDTMASGALPCLARMGIRAGQEMEIASHANRGSMALVEWESGMILVEFNPEEIVETVFQGLEALMDNQALLQPRIAIQPTVRLCPLQNSNTHGQEAVGRADSESSSTAIERKET